MTQLVWERLQCKNSTGMILAWRTKVPGGWLVAINYGGGEGGGLTFYPDPNHDWDGASIT